MKPGALGALAVLATAAAFSPATAHAYCRTTTAPIPAGYDPTVSGCIGQGIPLAWPSMPVTYELNSAASKQVTLAEATPIFERSFAKWVAVSCATTEKDGGDSAEAATGEGHGPALSFADVGPTDAGYASCEAGPCGYSANTAPHVIIFRDSDWPYNDPENTLALTTVTFGEETGHIYAADMEINTHEHTVSTSVPPPINAYSLEAIATHEAGHFVGMAHSAVDTAVMYARYQPDAVTLTPDDIEGVCAIYPEGSSGAGSHGCAVGGAPRSPARDDGSLAAVALAAAVAGLLVSRLPRRLSGRRSR
jgi:hypothetical protein